MIEKKVITRENAKKLIKKGKIKDIDIDQCILIVKEYN